MNILCIGFNDLGGGMSAGLGTSRRLAIQGLRVGKMPEERQQTILAQHPTLTLEQDQTDELSSNRLMTSLFYMSGGFGASEGELSFAHVWKVFQRYQPGMFLWMGHVPIGKTTQPRHQHIVEQYKVLPKAMRQEYECFVAEINPHHFGLPHEHPLEMVAVAKMATRVWTHQVGRDITTIRKAWERELVGKVALEINPEPIREIKTRGRKPGNVLLDLDAPAPNLKHVNRWFHPEEQRYLTLAELKVIRGFPRWWNFHGLDHMDKLHQIVNGVSPFEAQIVAPWVENAFLELLPIREGWIINEV